MASCKNDFFCTLFSFRNIGKPQVAFVIAALFVFLSWVKEQDLVVVIIYKRTVSVVTAENRLPRNEKVNKSKKPISFMSKKKKHLCTCITLFGKLLSSFLGFHQMT